MWADVNYKDFGKCYEINEHGVVRSKTRYVERRDGVVQKRKSRIISWVKGSDGYPLVRLSMNNKRVTVSVHRLVALTFIPNPDGKTDVNHKDLNRWNPDVSNLEWMSHNENVKYSYALGSYEKPQFIGEKNPNAHRVFCAELSREYGCIKDCASELIALGYTNGSVDNALSQILKVCNGRSSHYLGFHFEFAD